MALLMYVTCVASAKKGEGRGRKARISDPPILFHSSPLPFRRLPRRLKMSRVQTQI